MITDFYIEANRVAERKQRINSPSGKYKLIIDSYKTKEGCWNYTKGTILKDNFIICEIRRNYSVFHHSFVVKDNQEWLISGRSYMGQTIVNLDTGEIFDDEKYKTNSYTGDEFCWADAKLINNDILMVLGCYWAGPYIYKFFDFTNPKNGWKEIGIASENNIEEFIYENEDMPPEYKNGKLHVYKTSKRYLPLNKLNEDITPDEWGQISEKDYNDLKNWSIVIENSEIFELQKDKLVKIK